MLVLEPGIWWELDGHFHRVQNIEDVDAAPDDARFFFVATTVTYDEGTGGTWVSSSWKPGPKPDTTGRQV